MPTWIAVGAHRCYAEGNLFVMELHGPVSGAEIGPLLAPQDELIARCSNVITLCDARDAALPSPEVRRYLAERAKRLGDKKTPSVVITSSIMLRTVVLLIERASMLLTGRPLSTSFVSNEPAAWDWIAARRQPVNGGARDPADAP